MASVEAVKPRVFVTNYAGHDYHDAEQYGEFHWITKGYLSFHSLDRVKYTIGVVVNQSRKQDWLLLSGRPIISVIAAMIWFSLHKQIKILVWDQKGKPEPKYRELIITDANMMDMLQVIQQDTAINLGG